MPEEVGSVKDINRGERRTKRGNLALSCEPTKESVTLSFEREWGPRAIDHSRVYARIDHRYYFYEFRNLVIRSTTVNLREKVEGEERGTGGREGKGTQGDVRLLLSLVAIAIGSELHGHHFLRYLHHCHCHRLLQLPRRLVRAFA